MEISGKVSGKVSGKGRAAFGGDFLIHAIRIMYIMEPKFGSGSRLGSMTWRQHDDGRAGCERAMTAFRGLDPRPIRSPNAIPGSAKPRLSPLHGWTGQYRP